MLLYLSFTWTIVDSLHPWSMGSITDHYIMKTVETSVECTFEIKRGSLEISCLGLNPASNTYCVSLGNLFNLSVLHFLISKIYCLGLFLELKNISIYVRASLVAQTVKNPHAVQETWIQSLGWEDPLEKGTATHSGILAWRIPWTEEPGRLQSMGPQRVRHSWATFTSIYVKC